MASKRGIDPTAQTVQLLCAKAAGRCEFAGCGEILYEEILTRRRIRNSVVAHIVASSPDGPRGDRERSHKLSQEIGNLMLLCPTHHTLIDSRVEDYPEALLLSMKKQHEDSVERLCAQLQSEPSEMITLVSPIKGRHRVTPDLHEQVQALLPEHHAASKTGQSIFVESCHEAYSSVCKDEATNLCRAAVRYVLERNIVCGNALSMMQVDESGNDTDFPIVLPEWSFVMGDMVKRTDNRFSDLMNQEPKAKSIFKEEMDDAPMSLLDMLDENDESDSTIIRTYSPCYYLRLPEQG